MFKEYEDTHCATHYNLCWKIGDEKPVSNFFLTIVGLYILYYVIQVMTNK